MSYSPILLSCTNLFFSHNFIFSNLQRGGSWEAGGADGRGRVPGHLLRGVEAVPPLPPQLWTRHKPILTSEMEQVLILISKSVTSLWHLMSVGRSVGYLVLNGRETSLLLSEHFFYCHTHVNRTWRVFCFFIKGIFSFLILTAKGELCST